MPTNADDLRTFLRTRRSIRRFTRDLVADSVIERILTTATYAPSAHNLQPWRFAVVERIGNPPYASRQRLARALTASMRADMLSAGASESDIEQRVAQSLRRMDEAPVIILLCRDASAVNADTPEETIMGIQSVANAATYLLLAAHAEGLGGNWICWPLYAQEETRKALDLPETWEPQAMVFVGWADEEPREKTVTPMEEVSMFSV